MRLDRITPLIVAASLFMENLDSSSIATALPAIAADLGTSPVTLKLAITSYLLSLAVFIPASTWLADRFGARRIFTTALAVFMAGSLGCAFSTSILHFVLARIVEGAGGAMMTPVSRLVMLRTVDKTDLVRAMMYVTVPATVAPLVGPAVGGFITTYWSWHGIFLVNIPIGLLGIVLAQRFIPQFETEREAFDFKGFALSGMGLAGIAFGFSVAGLRVLPWSAVAGITIFGIISMTLYVLHSRRVANPILDFSLLKFPTMQVIATGGVLFRAGVGAMPFLLPLLFQVGFGMTPFQSGLLTLSSALGSLGMRPLGSRFIRKYGFRKVLMVNAVLGAAFLGAGAFFTANTPVALIMPALMLGGIFRALQFMALNTIVYAEVETSRVNRAITLISVMQQMALSLGVAVGAFVVEMTHLFQASDVLNASDIRPAFIVVSLMAMGSFFFYYRLPADAGHQISGPGSNKKSAS